MAIRLVIKVGDSSSDNDGFRDGMLICTLDPNDALSDNMKKVYAIVDVPDSWASEIATGICLYKIPVVDTETELTPDTPSDARMRCRHVDLAQLSVSLGDASLESDWRDSTIVAVQDGSGLDISELQNSIGHDFPAVPDNNVITSGTHTVGTAGDYSNWVAAFADVGTPLIGDLTFNQITNTTEASAPISTIVVLSGNKVLFDSATPHNGDPTAGNQIIMAFAASPPDFRFRLNSTQSVGSAQEHRNLHFRGTAGAGFMHDVDVPINVTTTVHDILLDGGTFRGGFFINGAGSAEMWNLQAWDISGTGISLPSFATSMVAENCSVRNSDSIGFQYGNSASVTIRNCYSVDNTTWDFFLGFLFLNPTRESLASSNTDATGTGAITNVTITDEVVSILDSSSDFLKLKESVGDDLHISGTTPSISGNTAGIRGNVRPHGSTSIGADEFELILNSSSSTSFDSSSSTSTSSTSTSSTSATSSTSSTSTTTSTSTTSTSATSTTSSSTSSTSTSSTSSFDLRFEILFISVIHITNITKYTVIIGVNKPKSISHIFNASGPVRINPGDTIMVENSRISRGQIRNLLKHKAIKVLSRRQRVIVQK